MRLIALFTLLLPLLSGCTGPVGGPGDAPQADPPEAWRDEWHFNETLNPTPECEVLCLRQSHWDSRLAGMENGTVTSFNATLTWTAENQASGQLADRLRLQIYYRYFVDDCQGCSMGERLFIANGTSPIVAELSEVNRTIPDGWFKVVVRHAQDRELDINARQDFHLAVEVRGSP